MNTKGEIMRAKWILAIVLSINLIFCASSQKKIQQARTKDPQYQYNVGLVHLNRGNVDEAIPYLNRALTINPNYYLALNALGLAYFMKGNLQEALSYLQKCLAINPTFPEARNNLGMVYQEQGLLDKAQQEFRLAAADKNYNSRELPYYNLARLYLTAEKFRDALDHVQKAIELNKNMAMAYNLEGTIYEKLNQLDEAIESYKRAVKIDPLSIKFSYDLGVAYFKDEDFEKAGEIFEKILGKTTDSETKEKINQYLKIIKK
jgi:tetratricopeptide (TPR) repeat protein